MTTTQPVDVIKKYPWSTSLLATMGGLVYLIQSLYFAHTQASVLDEGAYLLKGYLFASGKYQPFQDYGPWTNHMPLSFLIPGWIEVIFGPGLRTGRYLAIVLGLVMLLGLFLITTRLANRWWGILVIWLTALNAPVLRIYTMMTSQVLVSCILIWILVLVLGPERKLWQIFLGVILAGLLVFTRLNMSPVLPMVLAYILWEHGKKVGLWALVTGILVVGVGHLIFWPGILKIWAVWSPVEIPLLEIWKTPRFSVPSWKPEIDLAGRFSSFFLSLRIHFAVLVGFLISLFMWPPKRAWKSDWRIRTAVFLGTCFIVLFAFHAWAALGKNYCVYCLPNYLMFFHPIGILFVSVCFYSWNTFVVYLRKWIYLPLMFGVSLGVGYSLVFGRQLIGTWIGSRLFDFVNLLWQIEIPRLRDKRIVPGKVPLWGLFENKFGWSQKQIIDVSLILIVLILFWIVLVYVARFIEGRLGTFSNLNISFNAILMVVYLIIGTTFTLRTGYVKQESDCGWDVISSYEVGGAHLDERIPPGSKIYWQGGLSTVPLLYIDDYELYPPQINDGYSYRQGGDSDELARYGWWNAESAELWLQDADVLLVEGHQKGVEKDLFDEISSTPPLLPCDNRSEIHIFIK